MHKIYYHFQSKVRYFNIPVSRI